MAMLENDWMQALQGEFHKPYYKELYQFVRNRNTVPRWFFRQRMTFSMPFT